MHVEVGRLAQSLRNRARLGHVGASSDPEYQFFSTHEMRLCLLHALALFSAQAWALHESDVGVIDWYKHLIGVPLLGAAETAPRFHSSGSLVLTATANNVLAALHPGNGTVGQLLCS